MQIFMVMLCLAGFADDGNLNSSGISDWSPVDATITFSVLNTWSITWTAQALGLTSWESGSDVNIVFSSSTDAELESLNPVTGASAGSVPKPAGSQSGFGVVFNADPATPVWHINSWNNSNLFYTEDVFTTWQTVSNPCGTDGRGIAFDGEYYWQSSSTSLVRFTPGGSSITFSGVAPTQISGVAIVPGDNPSYTYIMVTTYNTDIFILYSYDGANLVQLATGTQPAGLGNSNRLGLTWCEYRDSLFFSYGTSSGYSISELDFDVLSLNADTWAGIKSSFE
jgi:hypothetical protein